MQMTGSDANHLVIQPLYDEPVIGVLKKHEESIMMQSVWKNEESQRGYRKIQYPFDIERMLNIKGEMCEALFCV